ncbi:MAG: ABC transporter permease [Bacteroidales bacterium]|nr:ABC transporter permease [Bacteroidales bacterium]
MFRSYLKISFRNLTRQKGFSIINLLGLTLGLTVGFTILLYVFSELSYDNFHDNPEQIYRVAIRGNLGDMPLDMAVTPNALGYTMKAELPEIDKYTLFEHVPGDQLFSTEDAKFYENHLIYAENSFFDVFTIKFISGDPSSALIEPYTLILTQSLSNKLFGEVNPLGRSVRLNNADDYIVTGLIEDLPIETHLPLNCIISLETRKKELGNQINDDWTNLMYYTYIKLFSDVDEALFEKKLVDYINEKLENDFSGANISLIPYLQNIQDIHLKSNILGELRPNSDISYIYILTAIAIGILFIAGVNFMNLSTARSANRAKEVSIRKINGANKRQLIFQFLGESVFLSMIAFVFSISIIELILPLFNTISSKNIKIDHAANIEIFLIFFLTAFLFGIFSGSYPAFFLSSFKPAKVLSSKLRTGGSNRVLRDILVFIQFAISAGLIISTIIIYLQLNYVTGKELGFQKEGMISVFLRNEEVQKKAEVLKTKLLDIPGVNSASLANSIPGMSLSGSSYFPEGYTSDPWLIYNFQVDEYFIEKTFKMRIIQGRNFSKSTASDSSAVIINETLQEQLDWSDPIDKKFFYDETFSDSISLHVIGVVKDFHFKSLHESIEPTMIHFQQNNPQYLVIRLQSASTEYTLKNIEELWNVLFPDLPFDFRYVDESFDNLYTSEKRLSMLFLYLAIFAIFIACLGLLGIVSFTAEQRSKEIGIRKILGASIFSISKMLTLEYIKLIIYANFIAWPLSYLLMSKWLQNFSYLTPVPIWVFLLSLIITLLSALLIINLQTIKINSEDPVNSLRYD